MVTPAIVPTEVLLVLFSLEATADGLGIAVLEVVLEAMLDSLVDEELEAVCEVGMALEREIAPEVMTWSSTGTVYLVLAAQP